MKQSVLALVLVLLLFPPCAAAEPHLAYVGEQANTTLAVEQQIELWIEASDLWQLSAKAATGLKFFDLDGQAVTEGLLTLGRGSRWDAYILEVSFDLELLGEGRHELDLELELQGAQGILGLPLAQETWILPLNNWEVEVQRGLETYTLSSGQWFLLEPKDRVLHAGQEVMLLGEKIEAAALQVRGGDPDFWWDPSPLHLSAAEYGIVSLKLRGPSPGGKVILCTNNYLHIGSSWTLNGQPVQAATDPDGSLTVELPPLAAGVHTLSGAVQALLPAFERQGEIWAQWQGRKAYRTVYIERGWFDQGRVQVIQADTSSPLLLPDGRMQRVGGGGEIAVERSGLDVVIPLDSPAQPIWTGLPLAESVVWKIEAPEGEEPDFIMPVLIWDQGFSWRLVTRSGQWFLDTSAAGQKFLLEGALGLLSLERGSQGEINARLAAGPQGQSDGPWTWREETDFRYGSYKQRDWTWTIAIPRSFGRPPALSVEYSGKRVGFQIAPREIALRFSNSAWAWGVRFKSRTLWAEIRQPKLRLEMRPGRVELACKAREQGDLRLTLEPESVEVNYRSQPWEAYYKFAQGKPEGGIRYKHPAAHGQVLSVTLGALQVKNGLLLGELAAELGYELSTWCTLYLEGGLAATFSLEKELTHVDFRYGGGVIVRPLPQLAAAAGWNNKEKWHFKAGVVLPFSGRKKSTDFE
ncbi:MAG: hypothetical protein GX251_02360 [Firmicutes bacterium]|nr:hypothetical protein [Bacillota bacterium]